MNNYRLTIQYDGSRYNGWQRLNDTDNTIEQILTDAIIKSTGEKTKLIGSGRTDAGVHALAQTANFRCRQRLNKMHFTEELNSMLPEDIRVNLTERVPLDFHSRHSAMGKYYVYRIETSEPANPFRRRYSWKPDRIPDVKLMCEAAQRMIGEHDFKAFCTDAKLMPYTVKTVYDINIHKDYSCLWNREEPGIIELEFHGSGFLYNMVRIMAGTIVDAGLGRFSPADIDAMLNGGTRSMSGQLAPARGLFLKKAEYSY